MSYIDREKLQEQLQKKKSSVCNTRYTEGFNEAMLRVKSMIHSAPTEDVAPIKHGKWAIYEENDFDYEEPIFVNEDNLIEKSRQYHHLVTVPMCSICHRHALLDGGEEYVLSNYCSSCGAKMKVEDTSNE